MYTLPYRRYDLYDVEIVIHDRFTGPDGSMNAAPPGFHFVKLSLGEMLCEGQYDIRYVSVFVVLQKSHLVFLIN